MAYRTVTAARRVEVVHYRAMPLAAAVFFTALVLTLSAFTLFQAVTLARASHLECVRGGPHACVVVREYGPLVTRQTLPLGSIAGVEVRSHSGKNRTTYSVQAVMKNGDHAQLTRAGDRHLAELTRTVVADFLEGRAHSPTRIPLDAPSPLEATALAVLSFAIGTFSFVFLGRAAQLEIDLDRGTLHYRRARFPLRPVVRTLRVDQVRSARVTARPGSKGGTVFGVSLDLTDGEELALVPGGGGSPKHPAEVAERINALLERMRG